MKSNLKALVLSVTLGFNSILLGNTEPVNCSQEQSTNHKNNIELYYPTSFEGVASSLIYWSMYPVAWVFGVEGLLIMVPSKYPNGTVRSWGG